MPVNPQLLRHVEEHWPEYTPDMFTLSTGSDLEEMELFQQAWRAIQAQRKSVWGTTRAVAAGPELDIVREDGERLHVVNMSTYNYLGYASHPEVLQAAQAALARYGLGSCASPFVTKCLVHQELEEALARFYGLPEHRAAIFSSGYGLNVGVIQTFIRPGNCVLVDANAHVSIREGARASGGTVASFNHNDLGALEKLLRKHCDPSTRVLICVDALYSCDGDRAPLRDIVTLARRHGAFTLADEAHAILVAGANGRGICEEQGVLADVDLITLTFSKSLASLGGAVLARREIAQYFKCFAPPLVFSCALPPANLGALVKILELAQGEDGRRRRQRIQENTAHFRGLLQGKVDLGTSEAWIVTVRCGPDPTVIETQDFLQRDGLDAGIMTYPAVAKDQARLRLFVTSEHTRGQLERAADSILRTAARFGFPTAPGA